VSQCAECESASILKPRITGMTSDGFKLQCIATDIFSRSTQTNDRSVVAVSMHLQVTRNGDRTTHD